MDQAWIDAARTYGALCDSERAAYWNDLGSEQKRMLTLALEELKTTDRGSEILLIEGEPPAAQVTDRVLLERIAKQLEEQRADIRTIRRHTGCLYAWLIITLVLGVIVWLVAANGL